MKHKLIATLLTALLALAVGLTSATAEVVLPDVPALELSDMDIDFAAIEELLPQATYRVENGELIVEGTNFTSVFLIIYDIYSSEEVALTYHPEDGTWRTPCESLEIENRYSQIRVIGDNVEFCYQSDGYHHWSYNAGDGVSIKGNNENELSISYEQGKYDAFYNTETGELTNYNYYDKTVDEIIAPPINS